MSTGEEFTSNATSDDEYDININDDDDNIDTLPNNKINKINKIKRFEKFKYFYIKKNYSDKEYKNHTLIILDNESQLLFLEEQKLFLKIKNIKDEIGCYLYINKKFKRDLFHSYFDKKIELDKKKLNEINTLSITIKEFPKFIVNCHDDINTFFLFKILDITNMNILRPFKQLDNLISLTSDDFFKDFKLEDQNFMKYLTCENMAFNNGLTYLENIIIHYILENNLHSMSLIGVFGYICSMFKEVYNLFNKLEINSKIKNFIIRFSSNSSIAFFNPKTYQIIETTEIEINLNIMKIVFLNNTYHRKDNIITYYTLIPLIYFTSINLMQVNIDVFCKFIISTLNKENIPDKIINSLLLFNTEMTSKSKTASISLQYNLETREIIKYKKNKFIINDYELINKFIKYDDEVEEVDNAYRFNKEIKSKKNLYIIKSSLSQTILDNTNKITKLMYYCKDLNTIVKTIQIFYILYSVNFRFLIFIKLLKYSKNNEDFPHKDTLITYMNSYILKYYMEKSNYYINDNFLYDFIFKYKIPIKNIDDLELDEFKINIDFDIIPLIDNFNNDNSTFEKFNKLLIELMNKNLINNVKYFNIKK